MIINGFTEYNKLLERMSREQFILTPICRDVYLHRKENTILCVGIMFENRDSFVVSVSHDDALTFDVLTDIKPYRFFTNDDVMVLGYVNGTTVPSVDEMLSPYVQDTQHQFGMMQDANKIVPITVWTTLLEERNNMLWNVLTLYRDKLETPEYVFTTSLVKTLRSIEDAGIAVDSERLINHFGDKVTRSYKGNLVYSEYNPYTTTGRPSNRYAGINFSALNKNDGSRDAFISRYEGGHLVQIDFEAYHLRLVADDLGVHLPEWKSIHTELAKVYFDTDEITEEMYGASKAKTFEIMYGMSDESFGFELFERIQETRRKYDYQTSITLPSGVTVNVDLPNASKLFNYYVQSLEVTKTAPKLQAILDILEDKPAHLILYTYDSVLLDMKELDTKLMDDIVAILEENKKFPVRVYTGKTYGTLVEKC